MRALVGNKGLAGDAGDRGVKAPALSGPGLVSTRVLGDAAPAWATNSSMVLGVYEGGRPLGTIEVGATCIARYAARLLIGEFENRRTAIRVFFEHGRAGTILVTG
jgi:hypothetical protein